MHRSPEAWHSRFIHQAAWTADLRRFLFERAGLAQARRVLEVGCGTGALLESLEASVPASCRVYGLDTAPSFLKYAHSHLAASRLVHGDAYRLPFCTASFDIIFCHFFLLWISNPVSVLEEMAAATRPGGAVLAFAEPDYGGRIDYPKPLETLGKLQTEALQRQGADPFTGRKLALLFHQAGFEQVETGVMGGFWGSRRSQEDNESEWSMITSDLADTLPDDQLQELKRIDLHAWNSGARVLYIPTFFAWGKVGEKNRRSSLSPVAL